MSAQQPFHTEMVEGAAHSQIKVRKGGKGCAQCYRVAALHPKASVQHPGSPRPGLPRWVTHVLRNSPLSSQGSQAG